MRITNAFYAELPLIQKICGDAVEVHVVQNVRGFFPKLEVSVLAPILSVFRNGSI